MKQSKFIEMLGAAFDEGWRLRSRRLEDGKLIGGVYDEEYLAAQEKWIYDQLRELNANSEM
jgi:hypothetical protein